MIRTYNIGTECYAIITSTNDPEFILPVKIVILEKYLLNNRKLYRVKILDMFETDLGYLKEHFYNIKVTMNPKSDNKIVLLKKPEVEALNDFGELLEKIKDKSFYIEENYISLTKDGMEDLYNRFVKYIINYHFRRLYQLLNRKFLIHKPVYCEDKEIFKRRVERIGFGDALDKYDLKLDI